ncbi:MAG: hypothetical protein WBX01_09195 [Nitrososphaeraceae archaeon]
MLDRNKSDIPDNGIFVQYDILHKTFIEKGGWALSWPQYDEAANNCKNILQDEMKSQHIGIPEYFKYKNTLDFYAYCLSR